MSAVASASPWDALAPTYDRSFLRPVDHAEDVVLADLYGPLSRLDVVDVGAGTGHLLDFEEWRAREKLVPASWMPRSYHAVDESVGMLERLAVKWEKAQVHLAPSDQLPLPDESADLVVCLWAFGYFPRQSEAMREMVRVLAPGGRLVVQGYSSRYERRTSHVGLASWIRPTTPSSLRAMAIRAGINGDAMVYGMRHLPDAIPNALPLSMTIPAVRAAGSLLPAALALTHIVVGRKPCRA